MYRVMLIDDEINARNLLRASIEWEKHGLMFAGEAASGIEAINVIDEIKPDIVFVDIFMPFMNGIEFTKIATERYPNLVVIVLTGFDDFEYARQCVSLPVVEYMLKPIVRKEVNDVLTRVVDILNQKQDKITFTETENNTADISSIARYLSENFKDPSINLTSIAQQFGYNSCYLSRRFKQEVGMSFVEYLMKCRMEAAIVLAGSGTKMFVTAGEVGIPDPNYFSRCFKKYTGVSYKDYK